MPYVNVSCIFGLHWFKGQRKEFRSQTCTVSNGETSLPVEYLNKRDHVQIKRELTF